VVDRCASSRSLHRYEEFPHDTRPATWLSDSLSLPSCAPLRGGAPVRHRLHRARPLAPRAPRGDLVFPLRLALASAFASRGDRTPRGARTPPPGSIPIDRDRSGYAV
jgi:hypothetical protein